MGFIELIILAIALSIDACVVSFTYGLVTEKCKLLNSLLLAGFTGFFQLFMPILGFYFADILQKYIQEYASYIVFVIFGYLGVKFIKEAFEEKKSTEKCLNLGSVFFVAVATSVDAFSAGVPLFLSGNKILPAVMLIGAVTFINSLFGFWGGFILKKFSTMYLEILAGVLLIGLGIKALC